MTYFFTTISMCFVMVLTPVSVVLSSEVEPVLDLKQSWIGIRAADVAARDFSRELKARMDGETSALALHMSKIQNYKLSVTENRDSCTVTFDVKPLNGSTLRGGGAEYLISIPDLKILKVAWFK